MKDLIKNPMFYYLLVPVVVTFWPILLSAVHLPAASKNWQKQSGQYEKIQKHIEKILTLDPERLEYAKAKKAGSEFDYANAVEQVARICAISASNYKLSSGVLIKTRAGQKTQDANVILNNVNIEKFAKFLSIIQLRWPSLQCIQVKLTKLKGAPDIWKADIRLKYYY